MFNGIIFNKGFIKKISKRSKGINIFVKSDLKLNSKDIGVSIACDGVCLTLIKIQNKIMEFYLSNETVKRSKFKYLKVNDLGGQFQMEMGAGGEISEAKGSLSLRDGFARVSGFAPTVKIPRLDAVWRHQPQETILQNLFVDFEQYGQVLASGKRYLVDGIFETEINLNLPEMDFELSRHLWPARFAKVGSKSIVVAN